MPRKYKFSIFNHVYHVRLNEAESLEFKRIAEGLQTTRATLLRKIIREVIGEGPDFLKHDFRVIGEAIYQIGGLGRNLNQLMRAIHMGKVAAIANEPLAIETLQKSVEALQLELYRVVDRSRKRWVKVDRS